MTTNRLDAQTCDFYEGTVSFKSSGGNQSASYQTEYILLDPATGTIQYLSDTSSFDNVAAGMYEVYAINYSKKFDISGLNINSTLDDIKSLCPPDMSGPLLLNVCSKPLIVQVNQTEADICLDIARPFDGPVFTIQENDGDSLELHVTITSGGDPLFDSLDVDLSAFSNAIKSFNYPTLIISADNNSNEEGIAPSDAITILNTLNLIGGSSTYGLRTIEVKVIDPEGNESNVAELFFNGINCTDCSHLIPLESDIRFQEDCNSPYAYCMPIHMDSMFKYEIRDNGVVRDDWSTCAADTVIFYSYLSLVNEVGPFEIELWDVGDRSLRVEFNDFDELAFYMDTWDVLGRWSNNSTTNFVEGLQIRPEYGALEIVQVNSGKRWTLEPSRRIQRKDYISVDLAQGQHEVVIVNTIEMCFDTIDISIICDDAVAYVPEFISLFDTVMVGQTDTFCLDHDNLEIVGIYNECEPSSGEYVRFGSTSSCITFEGIEVGLDSFCVVACGPLGDCDTTTLFVNVIPTIFDPIAVDDSASTMETTPVLVDILGNDDLNNGILKDIYILDDPSFGSVNLDRANEFLAEYIPKDNFCGWVDSFTYVIANEVGQDTATVIVDIACDSLRVLNGFSPNGDGVNDVFVILGIEDIEENRVRVYNRWGNMIYSKERYNNQTGWDGTWEGNMIPDGTYFYTIEDKARRLVRTGWVQLHRG